MGLALGLGSACSPDLDPRTCDDEVVGELEDWNAEAPVATPECAELPPEPVIGFCMQREGEAGEDVDGPRELSVEISGEIVGLGNGKPADSCVGLSHAGNFFDEYGELVAPEDVRWIRIDADGETWVLVLAAPDDHAPLVVGSTVRAWFERKGVGFGFGFQLDLRDAEGEPLWWFRSDSLDPVEHAPGCLPMRLGEPICNSADQCSRLQHHALEIGGTTVGPHEQVVVGGLRFTNAASWLSYDTMCTDYPHSHRMLAATREG